MIPRVLGDAVGLSPLVVLIAILMGWNYAINALSHRWRLLERLLTARGRMSEAALRGVQSRTSGKWRFEVTIAGSGGGDLLGFSTDHTAM